MNPPNMMPPPPDRLPEYDWTMVGDFFAFHLMLTPILVRILFAIGIPIIVIASFIYCFEGYNPTSYAPNGGGRFIGALLLSAVALPIWRVVCETAIVLFSIHEEIQKK
jgi:hypothetical protein